MHAGLDSYDGQTGAHRNKALGCSSKPHFGPNSAKNLSRLIKQFQNCGPPQGTAEYNATCTHTSCRGATSSPRIRQISISNCRGRSVLSFTSARRSDKLLRELQKEADENGKSESRCRPSSSVLRGFISAESPLISEAILTLKDRRGSSQQAIAKFIEDKYGAALPSNFRKILSVQLRKLVKSEKLSKIKNSYKVSSGPQRPTPLVTKLKGKRAMKKKEKSKTKIKRLSQVQTPEALKGAEKGMPEKGRNRKLKRLSQIRTPEDLRKTNKKRNLIAGKGKDVTLKN
ncbi:hypothetical protein CRG98_029017 [Punica granatum]|uniref:H15 domain-containing protein n=1 Tax=Punica granatum TaxID=22663 RepID=A0A2I0J2X0_PUNGR|nr:hypothetical protein CRG98_029017 [Punica granatum]